MPIPSVRPSEVMEIRRLLNSVTEDALGWKANGCRKADAEDVLRRICSLVSGSALKHFIEWGIGPSDPPVIWHRIRLKRVGYETFIQGEALVSGARVAVCRITRNEGESEYHWFFDAYLIGDSYTIEGDAPDEATAVAVVESLVQSY